MGLVRKELYYRHQNTWAEAFAVLSHPGMLKIIFLLLQTESLTLGKIQAQLNYSQSATSDKVRKLKDAGLLNGQQIGVSVRYRLNKELLQ